MANEKAQVETTTDQNNVAGAEANVREDDNTQSEATERREPDFKIAMHEERRKRQEIEQLLNDPNFVYERAKALGLTEAEEEALDAEEAPAPKARVPRNPEADVLHLVTRQLQIEKAKEKYPELATDDDLGLMVTALINKGEDPLSAADKVFARIRRDEQKAQAEGAKQKEKQISDKERAQTISGGIQVADDVDEMSKLRQLARQGDKKAQLEIIKRRNKASGVFDT